MIVQIINMEAPNGEQESLRSLIEQEYIPAFRDRPGFVSATVQTARNGDGINILLYWSCREDIDLLRKDGVIVGSALAMAAHMPGLRVRQQGCIIGGLEEPCA